jgi:NADH-quinone oxidoreductase subunit M
MFFAQDYFAKDKDNHYFIFANLLLFLGGMNGVILSIDTIQFYFFYELMLIPSYLVLAFYGEGEKRSATALKYFIFTHVGAVLLFVAFLGFYSLGGVTSIAALSPMIATLGPAMAQFLFLMVFLGFAFKMAIFPFHTWLPDTYNDSPLPLTLMLAAGMINTGVYGMARFMFLFPHEVLAAFAYPLMVMAVITQFYGGLMALAETNIKKIIAYSSISQMGYILLGFASLMPLGIMGSMAHALNHGLAKGLLFVVAGTVILVSGKKYINEVSGLGAVHKELGIFATIGALAILGAPPLCGFTSEWMIFAGGFASPFKALTMLSVIATAITTGYSLYFVKRIFYGPLPADFVKIEIPGRMMAVMAVLVFCIFAVGIYPAFTTSFAREALNTMAATLTWLRI